MRNYCLIVYVLAGAVSAIGQTDNDYRVYVSGLHQGDLAVFDGSGKKIQSIPVQDGAGTIGVAISSDGKSIFVTEDDHLRIVDARTGSNTHTVSYEGALHLLGQQTRLHLTADNRLLLIKTYDLGAAAAGVRIFDVGSNQFTGIGMRGRACPSPEFESTRDGTLFSICPESIQMLRIQAKVSNDLSGVSTVKLALRDVAGTSVTPRGDRLFAIETVQPGRPWQLVCWTPGEPEVQTENLSELLKPSSDSLVQSSQAWIASSPDGTRFAIHHGTEVWMLDAQTLKLIRQWDLKRATSGLGFSSDGHQILTLDDSTLSLFRIPLMGGEPGAEPLNGLKTSMGAKAFLIGAVPKP